MNRQAQVVRMIENASPASKNVLSRSFSGRASPRQAIKAMCLTCVGYERKAIENCTGWSCPLWEYRPFKAT